MYNSWGDEGAACTRSIIYFIDRKQFKILSCFDSRSRIDCLVSTNNILYASLYNRVTTNRCRTSRKLKSYKINDAENVYLEREDFYKYEYEIENMIEFNNQIIANSRDSLIILNV